MTLTWTCLPPANSSPAGRAVRQIGRRRRFWFWATVGTLLMTIVTVGWAFSE
jgi:hypothetical protein